MAIIFGAYQYRLYQVRNQPAQLEAVHPPQGVKVTYVDPSPLPETGRNEEVNIRPPAEITVHHCRGVAGDTFTDQPCAKDEQSQDYKLHQPNIAAPVKPATDQRSEFVREDRGGQSLVTLDPATCREQKEKFQRSARLYGTPQWTSYEQRRITEVRQRVAGTDCFVSGWWPA
ncbi:hypothetical protein SAMN02745857_03787 [Andreprevotia lacus DSM 23236]|uniref:Uncharacterized protein n=2 Tax=Andreprevotia TaxID=397275 RepID=A0A1W1XZL8_9NEIS|nr:hypothetical protein SAMN02745857_03787 [Andreprevotia lacus DSM 23236]